MVSATSTQVHTAQKKFRRDKLAETVLVFDAFDLKDAFNVVQLDSRATSSRAMILALSVKRLRLSEGEFYACKLSDAFVITSYYSGFFYLSQLDQTVFETLWFSASDF